MLGVGPGGQIRNFDSAKIEQIALPQDLGETGGRQGDSRGGLDDIHENNWGLSVRGVGGPSRPPFLFLTEKSDR